MTVLSAIGSLERASFVTDTDLETALLAEKLGTPDHTIGFETEVLGTAIADVPAIRELETDEDMYYLCRSQIKPFGFGIGGDGVYELQSPPAKHPETLAIAVRGVVNSGFLPSRTRTGLVTAHVSIGSKKIKAEEQTPDPELIRILRATELNDGTTPRRITAPVERSDDQQAWNTRGTVGVTVNQPRITTWQGANRRIEFRTLGYYSPSQFEKTLKIVYFLSRGHLSSQRSEAHKIYSNYSEWFREYCESHQLPDLTDQELPPTSRRKLEEYLSPYSDHLAHHDRKQLKAKTRSTVASLSEELGMTL